MREYVLLLWCRLTVWKTLTTAHKTRMIKEEPKGIKATCTFMYFWSQESEMSHIWQNNHLRSCSLSRCKVNAEVFPMGSTMLETKNETTKLPLQYIKKTIWHYVIIYLCVLGYHFAIIATECCGSRDRTNRYPVSLPLWSRLNCHAMFIRSWF